MLTVLSAVVALACALASARRLLWAVSPAALDPGRLAAALKSGPGSRERVAAIRRRLDAHLEATWERDLFAAAAAPDARARVALVNEQLGEMDWRARRWERVPRVCASVATSAGFLFACVAVVRGLGQPTAAARDALLPALNALAVGIAGTSFCAAVHVRARRIAEGRLAATDRLVERLEAIFRED